MKNVWMILTLCGLLTGAATAQDFNLLVLPNFDGQQFATVAWGDVDNNGYADLFCGGTGTTVSKLFLHTEEGWNDAARLYDMPEITDVRTARLIDYNNDGLLDLFCLTNTSPSVVLFRQTESQRFQPVSLNLDEQTDIVRSAVWCDANEDGQLDLLLSNRSGTDPSAVLLVASEDEMIEDRAADGPFAETGILQISTVDFDKDGDLDYFMTKDDGSLALWVDLGGVYQNIASDLYFPNKIGMSGITWADFNRDGALDIFTSGSEKDNCIYYQGAGHNGPTSNFYNVSEITNMRTLAQGAKNAHTVDANADGRTDLFVINQTGGILIYNTANGWELASHRNALMQPYLRTVASAWADFDNDGDMDVAVVSETGYVRVFANGADRSREYVGLKLCDATGSAPVLNCLVTVQFESGKQWAASSMYDATVGGDDLTRLLYSPTSLHNEQWVIYVQWPNGAVSHYTQNDLPLNGTHTLCMPMQPAIEAPIGGIVPLTVSEVNNYPNPFNPTTQITFNLSEAADVTLTVFNLLGQEVAILARGNFNAGQHSLAFDAAALPSGLYLARLDTPAGSVVHRMLLTK